MFHNVVDEFFVNALVGLVQECDRMQPEVINECLVG